MKTRIIFVLLAALTAGLCSCNGGNDPQPKPSTDFDKMIGTWTLNSYTENWVNIDADKVEKDRTVNRGSLTIKKEKDGDDSYYTYTENFVNEEGTEYSGRIEITNGCIILSDPEGFMRGDGGNTYDFNVTFPAEGKMEWTYSSTKRHIQNTDAHNDKRDVKGVFTKG